MKEMDSKEQQSRDYQSRELGRFRVEYVNTALNKADVFTKRMPYATFRKFVPWLLGS